MAIISGMQLTTQDLTSLLKQLHGTEKEEGNSQFRYIIYARKSTDEKERQVRSLGDQVIECREHAEHKGLNVVGKPIPESESAKEPDIRPKFREMLNEIKKGKYDGIIAWHPDRLARNMKDAGEIIDLLDKGIIKDLQFVSFTFENSTSGKMLLGIAFVLSKQYSDKLSDDVKRGQRRSIGEGKYISKGKHGYFKDRNQVLRPDKDNFTLIKKAWEMRLDNKKLQDIATYLNESRYSIPDGIGGEAHKPYNMDVKRLSELFKDSFYAGVLAFGETQKTIVNLTEIYDFVPMIEVDDFLKINRFDSIEKALKQKFRGHSDGSIKADLLRGAVICAYCDESMTAGITPKKNRNGTRTNYFYYRCDTPKCSFKNKSIRAKVITEFVNAFLEYHKFTTKSVYDHYVSEMKSVIREKEAELDSRRRSLNIERRGCEDRIEKIKNYLLEETDTFIKDSFKNDLKVKENELTVVLDDIENIKQAHGNNKGVIYSYKEFLELFDNMPVILRKTKGMREKDYIIRKIFLNFTIKDKKVASYQLIPPFDGFIKEGKFRASRG